MTSAAVQSGAVKRTRAKTMDRATVVVSSSSTGRIVRLSDPEMRPSVQAMIDELANDPEAARKWLQELGYLTPKGNVTRRYGGR